MPLLNIIESQNQKIERQGNEIQGLRNEINHLKGEQGKPEFKTSIQKTTKSRNISSESERKDKDVSDRKTNRRKKRRKDLPIHKTEICKLDKTDLPDDLELKDYSDKIIQGITFGSFNILAKREIWYSPSNRRCYTAKLPSEYRESYTAELQTFIIEQKYLYNMTEPKILEMLLRRDFLISAGTISNILLNNGKDLSNDREDILRAGIIKSKCVQTDTTGCVENGVQKQNHNFNSPYFSVFYTKEDRKRITVIDILRGSESRILALNKLENRNDADVSETRIFTLNKEFFEILVKKGIAKVNIDYLKQHATDELLRHNAIEKVLSPFLERKNLYSQLYELAYIAGYHAEEGYPIVEILLTDDAPVYDYIAFIHILCWIHEGRHFKKLNPLVSEFKNALDDFLTQFWNFYHALLDFKKNPSTDYAILLEQRFDALFTQVTNYDTLNERIEMTFRKKEELLGVLKHSFLPLHNNESELDARKIARNRDVSFQTKNKEGTQARDIFLSISATAKKLNVDFFDYLVDRISRKFEMPSLATVIQNIHPP